MATKYNIKDWRRGTNPGLVLTFQREDGTPYDLNGSTVAIVIRDEEWEDSLTDDTAIVKVRSRLFVVLNEDNVPSVGVSETNDICWISDIEQARRFDGTQWIIANAVENRLIDGIYTIRFTREQMMIPVETYYYSIDIKFGSGEVQKVMYGTFKVTPNTVNEI